MSQETFSFRKRGLPSPALTFTGLIQEKACVRMGRLAGLWEDGVAMLMAVDAPDQWPRRFFARHWERPAYLNWLFLSWDQSRHVPLFWNLKSPLPRDFAQTALDLPFEDQIRLIEGLRKGGVLPALPKLQRSTLPRGLAWEELPKLYLKQEREL